MLKDFLKKSSRLLAVVLAVTLSLSSLSYGATPTTFTEFQTMVSDGTAVITVDNVVADSSEVNKKRVYQKTGSLTIEGMDGMGIIDAGNGNNNVGFRMKEGQDATVNNVTFRNFYNDINNGDGAVIYNGNGTLTITDSVFENNYTTRYGGAILNANAEGSVSTITNSEFSYNSSGNDGGAIANKGNLEIVDTNFYYNSTAHYGSAIYARAGSTTTITGGEIAYNATTEESRDVYGGAILNSGNMTIDGTTISYNTTMGRNAAAIYGTKGSTTTITGATVISHNAALSGGEPLTFGGAVNNYGDMTIGDGVIFDSNDSSLTGKGHGGAIYNNWRSNVTIGNDVQFTYNKSGESGGAVDNDGVMTIGDGVQFIGNEGLTGDAGAIYNWSITVLTDGSTDTFLTIGKDAVFESNSAADKGGAIANRKASLVIGENADFSHNTAAKGGAVYNFRAGVVEIGDNSKFSHNVATEDGGAIYNDGEPNDDPYSKDSSKIEIGEGTEFSQNTATNGGAIYNSNGGEVIIGEGTTFLANLATENGGAIYNAAESTVTIKGATFSGNIANGEANDIYNDGLLVFESGTTTMDGGIDGEGTTTINEGVTVTSGVDSTIEQSEITIDGTLINENVADEAITANDITISETGSLTTNASAVKSENGLLNDGVITFTGGTNNNEISGEGELVIDGIVENADGTSIDQDKITVNENAEFTTNVGDISAASGVENSGDMIFVGDGENNNEITGSGNLTIEGSVTNNTTITQGTIAIAEDGTLVTDAGSIVTDNAVKNAGELEFTGGTNANVITGEGSLSVTGDVVNEASIKQSEVAITGSLETAVTDIVATDGITNDGSLTYTGEGTNKNDISGEGNLTIEGTVENATGTSIEQTGVTVNGSLTANADDITTADGIVNDGTLTYNGGTNDNVVSGSGELVIDGDVENADGTSIEQDKITVNEGAEFTTNVGDITATSGVENSGDMIFVGDGENNNEISGSGDLTIEGNVTNNSAIAQGTIAIAEDGSLITDAGNIVTESEVRNLGDLEFTGGTNANVISGDGSLKVTGEVVNEASVKQSEVEITAEGSLETDVSNIVATDGITNDGSLTYTGEGTNKNDISGEGNLTIEGTVENATGTSIEQTGVTVNGSLTANADDITTSDGILNDGTLTYTGGTNDDAISGSGDLVVDGIVENATGTSIEQTTITVAEDSTFITAANDLNISDSITLTGDETLLNLTDEEDAEIAAAITGSGKIVKEGEGTVTLSGSNDYAGTTTISDGAIEILAADGISTNTLYMDGGKLIISGDSDVELGNEIIGTDHNDVNIEVNGEATTVLTGEILGNEDLVKTGEGILELQMESNSYSGDTKIEEGGVIGNTANINGTVTGNGEGTSVEFNDDGDDVTLNTIDNIGLFEKTGSATMEVTNDFSAVDANISAGTFVINNDSELGSGSTFEVTGDMRVENAVLKGYGDITAGNLIIGSGAEFAPGNSTATFKVSGNLTFEGGSNYNVEFGQVNMDEEGHYNDSAEVSGTTTIGDDAQITLNNLEGKYYVAETIDLITSNSGVDGEYNEANVTFNDNDAIDLRPGYDTRISTRVYTEGNALKLELQRKRSEYSDTLEFERSHNEQEAAAAIDAISTGNDGDITYSLDAMEKMFYYQDTYDIDGLKAALNDIAGVIHSNATNLTFFNAKAEHVYDKIKERTKDILPCNKVHDKIWAEYYYNNYNVDKDENSPKQDLTVNGFLVGFDMINSKNWTMGIMGGYGTSELKHKKDKADMKDINLGLYGGYESAKWLLKGMLLGGYEQYDITRKIAFMDRTATSEHKGYSGALDLEAGYKISLNRDNQAKHRMYLKPFIGATGSYMNNEGYEEKGADSLNLKVNDYSEFAAEARAGLELNGKVKRFGWYVKAGARQLLTEDYREIELSLLDYADITKMNIRSAKNARTTLMGGIGADYDLSENWTIFANGLGNFADVSTNYYANVGLAYRFGCKNNKPGTDEDTAALLNEKIAENEELKKELEEARAREKELQDKLQQEAKVVSEEEAQQMKENTIKSIKISGPTFNFGTTELSESGKEKLKDVVEEIKNYPDADILIEGHTDNIGKEDYNQKLSERRASSIATALKKDYQIPNDISIIGKGEKEPIATNDTKEGRAQNRRVEIIITTAE